MAKIKNTEEDPEKSDQIEELLKSKEFKGSHYGSRSGDEINSPDIITTGSFFFDQILDGGFRSSSWCRFFSEPECGKSSMGLKWGKNWQDYYGKQGFVVYFNAEGRLTKNLLDRSGINTSKDRFRVIDCNVSDSIYSLMEKLVQNNPDDLRYMFLVDSTDSCIRNQDIEKNIGDAEKIGGGATIISAAGKRLSLIFNRLGHTLYMCSQLRDKVNTHGPGGGGKDASGGNAPRFYSSLTGEIKKPWTDTYIFESPSDTKSKPIGRLVEIKLVKTPNESTGQIIRFPVRYGMVGGVWRAYESMMVAQAWGFVIQNKAFYSISDEYAQELLENNIDFEPKFHGEKAMREYFDTHPELVEYTFDKIKKVL